VASQRLMQKKQPTVLHKGFVPIAKKRKGDAAV
jgi:hypothetical protein